MSDTITITSKEEQQAELIAKRDAVTEEITGVDRERERLAGERQTLSERYAALSDQIDALQPTTNECVRAYIATQEKVKEQRREEHEETRSRLAAAGVSVEDVIAAAETRGARRR